METTIQPVNSLSLSDMRERFHLTRDRSDRCFGEWIGAAPTLTDYEQQALERLRGNYENILESNPLEEVVKLVVVAPLLDLAGFYQPPFSIRTEVSTRLYWAEGGISYSGSIDVLVIQQRLWVLVVESKQSRLDVTAGIPQALCYLLSQPEDTTPQSHAPRFGMVTNGREVLFLKLQPHQPPTYSQSRVYQLVDRLEDLPQILQALKAIGQQMS